MYRFALRPWWLLSHVFALVVVLGCGALGLWQLDRHDQRADRNATVVSRTEQASVPVTALLEGAGDVEQLRFRAVTAAGDYEDRSLLVDNRSRDGLPGAWVLSPLVLDDGSVLVVNRGFQGFEAGSVEPPPPPADPVRVEGTVVPWEDRSCGTRSDGAGAPVGMACLLRSGAEAAFGGEVLPVVVQRRTSAPPEAEVLTPVPLPELDSGPHRSYAAQWFIFGTIALVGYPLILRRVARDRATGGGPDDPSGDAARTADPHPADAPVG